MKRYLYMTGASGDVGNGRNIFGILLAYLMAGIIVFGTPYPIIITILGVNPFSQTINDFIFTDSMYSKNTTELIISEVISYVLFAGCVYLFFKYTFIFLLVPCLMLVTTASLFQMFNRYDTIKTHSEDFLLHHFESTRLVCAIAKDFVGQQTLHSIIASQGFLTITAWLSINCNRILPAFVVVTMTAAFLGCLGLSTFILTMMANARAVSSEIIRRKRAEFTSTLHGRWVKNKYFGLKWKAQRPLPLYCGTNFAINKDAVLNFISVLTTNITNAVLLIVP